MVFLWFSYGFPMVFLWFSYGSYITGLYSPSDLRVTSKNDQSFRLQGRSDRMKHDLHLRVIAIDVMPDQQQKMGDQPYQPYLTININ